MAIQARWDQQSAQVIRFDFGERWASGSDDQMMELSKLLLAQSSGQVRGALQAIFNLNDSQTPSVQVLEVIRRVLAFREHQFERFVVVSKDVLLVALLQLMQPFYEHFGVQVHVVESLPAAYTALAV